MKRIVVPLVAILGFSTLCHSQIAQWTFEGLADPGSPGPWLTNISANTGSGTASGFHQVPAGYTTPSGNGSSDSLSANPWIPGDLWQFVVSTVGYSGIHVSYDQLSSSSGPGNFSFAYSTDGVNFTTFAANNQVSTAWNSYSDDLSAVTALDNASTVYFRLIDNGGISAGGGARDFFGTSQIDNFTVFTVPEPSSILLTALGGALGLLALWRRR